MTNLFKIQKDVILFFIILMFLLSFAYWWGNSDEGFYDYIDTMRHNLPVPGLQLKTWTNSVINGRAIKIKWNELKFNTNIKNNPNKNSEFSLSFWFFLAEPKPLPQPLFRIIDLPNTNSPGVWLVEDKIQIKSSNKVYTLTPISTQTLDFYTIVFSPNEYTIYKNGIKLVTEKWGFKPEQINKPANAYLEIGTTATVNHYGMKDVKIYDDPFTSDVALNLYKIARSEVKNLEADREDANNAIIGFE
jgi:hypothetical protein